MCFSCVDSKTGERNLCGARLLRVEVFLIVMKKLPCSSPLPSDHGVLTGAKRLEIVASDSSNCFTYLLTG